MHIYHEAVLDCSGITADECSDRLLDALGHCEALKLKADHDTDTVHGSVSIVHDAPPYAHAVTVVIYDADEGPNEYHSTFLCCPERTPSAVELKRGMSKWLKP